MKNKQMLWFLIPLAIFVGLLAMLAFRLGKPTDIITSSALDKPLPSFELPLLADSTQTISNADLPKEPFLLNVWGSWCPTCYVEHPFLVKLHGEGVPMVGVNYKDELSKATAYLAQYQNPFLYSFVDYKGDFALDLGLMGAPETFLVDSEGVVRLHVVGELHQGNWDSAVKPCMTALADKTLDAATKEAACSAKVVRP